MGVGFQISLFLMLWLRHTVGNCAFGFSDSGRAGLQCRDTDMGGGSCVGLRYDRFGEKFRNLEGWGVGRAGTGMSIGRFWRL